MAHQPPSPCPPQFVPWCAAKKHSGICVPPATTRPPGLRVQMLEPNPILAFHANTVFRAACSQAGAEGAGDGSHSWQASQRACLTLLERASPRTTSGHSPDRAVTEGTLRTRGGHSRTLRLPRPRVHRLLQSPAGCFPAPIVLRSTLYGPASYPCVAPSLHLLLILVFTFFKAAKTSYTQKVNSL